MILILLFQFLSDASAWRADFSILGSVFGISGAEFFVLLLVLVIVVGPQRLPEYTRKLTQMVRQLRVFLADAKEQIAQEVGPELGDLDLSDLNPRNYDPRKIVRDALGEDLDAIRKDLSNPFESVLSAGKKASDEAAAEINKKTAPASKTRAQSISDKAAQTRQEKPVQTADNSAATSADSAKSVSSASEPVVLTTAADVPAAPAAEKTASDSPAPATDTKPPVESTAPAKSPENPVTAAKSQSGPAHTLPSEQLDAAQPDAAPTAQLRAAGAAVPTTLVETENVAASVARPISPREIVRAAKLAGRTPAAGADAVLEVPALAQ